MNKLTYEEETRQNLAKYRSQYMNISGWEPKVTYNMALQHALIELHRLAGQHTRDEHYEGIKMACDLVEDIYHGNRRER